jgi:AraC-like DNA-binding protein
VEAYWSFTAEKAGRSLVLPDGRCDIILHYNTHKSDAPVPIITGPATWAYAVEYEIGDCWLGIRLRPDNGCALWANGITQAADAVLSGPEALALLPRLSALNRGYPTITDLAETVGIIATALINHRISRALGALHTSGGRIQIEKLAEFVGCTPRHLNRIFRAHIGLNAKTYAQLVQFHRTLGLIQREHLPIAGAAFEGGYADHAHLTRAFRRFGGFTPSGIPDELSLPALFP